MLSGCNALLSILFPAENLYTTHAKTYQACALARAGTGARKRQTKFLKKNVGKPNHIVEKITFFNFRKKKV